MENTPHWHIATFDSGFGGFFTARAIAAKAAELAQRYHAAITVRHYGDTANVPYGEKTPQQIIDYATRGISHALREGADRVFIPCNSASVHYDAIRLRIEETFPGRGGDIISILNVSAGAARHAIDRQPADAHFAVLATPATVKSMVYPHAIAALYQTLPIIRPALMITQKGWRQQSGEVATLIQTSHLISEGKTVHIHQLAPANWVEMIEHGAGAEEKRQTIATDIGALMASLPAGVTLDGVGYFCTHYPVFDQVIREEIKKSGRATAATAFISQEPLMAELFMEMGEERLSPYRRQQPASAAQLAELAQKSHPHIAITGANLAETRELLRSLFPHDQETPVRQFTL